MTIAGYTTNFRFRKILYNSRGWHTDEWFNLETIDGILTAGTAAIPFVGIPTGTVDAIVLDYTPNVAYTIGQQISFTAIGANTGAVTVNCDGLGVKSLKNGIGGALTAGFLAAGTYVRAIYNGTDFIITVPSYSAFPTKITTAASGVVIPANADDFAIENNTDVGVTFASPAATQTRLTFARPLVVEAGQIRYNHATDTMFFRVNNVDRGNINSTGLFSIPAITTTGNVIIGGTLDVTGVVALSGALTVRGGLHVPVITNGTFSAVTSFAIPLIAGMRRHVIEVYEILNSVNTSIIGTVSVDGGAVYLSAGYSSKPFDFSTATYGGTSTTYFYGSYVNMGIVANSVQNITVEIDTPLTGTKDTRILGRTTSLAMFYEIHTIVAAGARVTHVKFNPTAGNTTGRWRMTSYPE